jgi:acyl-CoA thioester hydrolase
MLMRTAPPKLCDYPVRSVEKLRYADTDRNGHISNAVFAVCCQNARVELLGDPSRVPLPHNTQFVIAKLVLEFRAEMHWPGTVEIGTRVASIGRSSVILAQVLYMKERCVAVADSTVILMNGTTRRSMLLPKETAEALRSIALPIGSAPTRATFLGYWAG